MNCIPKIKLFGIYWIVTPAFIRFSGWNDAFSFEINGFLRWKNISHQLQFLPTNNLFETLWKLLNIPSVKLKCQMDAIPISYRKLWFFFHMLHVEIVLEREDGEHFIHYMLMFRLYRLMWRFWCVLAHRFHSLSKSENIKSRESTTLSVVFLHGTMNTKHI